MNHNCRDLVEKVPFLKEGGNDFISLVINQLGFDVFLPGDTIIKEGTFGNDMYFIRYGMVDVIADETVVTSLSEGEYFGEITMLTGARRVATVKAVTVCNLFILHKDNLFLALDEFPEMRVLLEHIALDRLMKLKVLVSVICFYDFINNFYFLKISLLIVNSRAGFQIWHGEQRSSAFQQENFTIISRFTNLLLISPQDHFFSIRH